MTCTRWMSESRASGSTEARCCEVSGEVWSRSRRHRAQDDGARGDRARGRGAAAGAARLAVVVGGARAERDHALDGGAGAQRGGIGGRDEEAHQLPSATPSLGTVTGPKAARAKFVAPSIPVVGARYGWRRRKSVLLPSTKLPLPL